jgi:hypothetical protein
MMAGLLSEDMVQVRTPSTDNENGSKTNDQSQAVLVS